MNAHKIEQTYIKLFGEGIKECPDFQYLVAEAAKDENYRAWIKQYSDPNLYQSIFIKEQSFGLFDYIKLILLSTILAPVVILYIFINYLIKIK